MKKTFSNGRVNMGWEKTASSIEGTPFSEVNGKRSVTISSRFSVCCNRIYRYEPSAYIAKMYL